MTSLLKCEKHGLSVHTTPRQKGEHPVCMRCEREGEPTRPIPEWGRCYSCLDGHVWLVVATNRPDKRWTVVAYNVRTGLVSCFDAHGRHETDDHYDLREMVPDPRGVEIDMP